MVTPFYKLSHVRARGKFRKVSTLPVTPSPPCGGGADSADRGDRGVKPSGVVDVDLDLLIFSRGRIKFSDRGEFSAQGMVAFPPSLAARIGTLGCAGWSE